MTLSSARAAPHPRGTISHHAKDQPPGWHPGCRVSSDRGRGGLWAVGHHGLAGLEGIGYSGLSVLLRVRRWTRRSGGDLPLAAPQQPVRRILEATGLIDVFAVNPNMEEAMNRARRQAVVTGRVAAAQCRSRISGPAH